MDLVPGFFSKVLDEFMRRTTTEGAILFVIYGLSGSFFSLVNRGLRRIFKIIFNASLIEARVYSN